MAHQPMQRIKQGHVDLELTSWHEAAHAVVALYHRRPVHEVRISTRHPGYGCTRFGPRMRWPAFDHTPGNIRAVWIETLAKYQAEIRILLAGPLAEAKLLSTPLRSLGARSDLLRAEHCFQFLLDAHHYLSRYCPLSATVPTDLLARERQYTRHLIARPRYWQAIEAIAAALLRRKRIQGADMTALIQSTVDARSSSGCQSFFSAAH